MGTKGTQSSNKKGAIWEKAPQPQSPSRPPNAPSVPQSSSDKLAPQK